MATKRAGRQALKRLLPLGGWIAVSLAASSCLLSPDPGPDLYSEVAPYCMTQDPQMGNFILTPEERVPTYLTPECKAALEKIAKLDDDSFAKAPAGMRDRVLEALQAIIAYPIVVDANDINIFGTHPPDSGAIPAAFIEIFQRWDNPNQSLFNYILNQVDVIAYGEADGASATYLPTISSKIRKITVHQSFWDPKSPLEGFRNPFVRASTLAHEARHGDGVVHEGCVQDQTGHTDFECDPSLIGAYGFGATYLKFLLHGSAVCSTPGCSPPMSIIDALLAGLDICDDIKAHLNYRWPELDDLLKDPVTTITDTQGNKTTVTLNFCLETTYKWIAERENIPLPPPAPSASPTPDPSTALTARSLGVTPDTLPNVRCTYHGGP